ncbi:MAG TPA: tyrosine-type recombinase/integrase [Candidatus Dormibacteraeota bacterium]|nr:tyrosine-type recombinase/integrase [Candidatus Dormibacteraeota bacterium]
MGRTKAKRIKRPNGAGSLYQRRDGRWHARYTIVDPETGQRVRRSLYGATEQEARANLTRALDAPGRGGLPLLRGRAPTLAEHGRRWLGQCRVRPKTLHRYAELLRYALPSLGHLQLTKLEAHHVGTLLTRLRDGGLSARTCNHVRSVLRNLLNQAKREGLVQRNVAELARPLPLEDVREGTTLSAEQVRMLLSVAEHHRDGPLWVLALATGARQSELVGLRWSDVDLERGTVTISRTLQPTPRPQREEHGEWLEQPTKTRRSRRTIPLASIAHGGAPSPAEAAGRGAAGGRKQLARRAW